MHDPERPADGPLVHCFRCDDVVVGRVDQGHDDLWCPECEAPVLAGLEDDGAAPRVGFRDGHLVRSDAAAGATAAGRPSRRSGGGLIGNALLGLHNALYGRRDDQPAIVVDDDEKDREGPVELHLDEKHPERSWARLRTPRSGR